MITNRRSLLAAIVAALAGAPLLSSPSLAAADLAFTELYLTGVQPTPKALGLVGRRITMHGYMAPPLKAEASFFVLTKVPMSVCPFCDSTIDWPNDIVLVRTSDIVESQPFNRAIAVSGVLEIGFAKDAETGFVSFVRLINAEFFRL